ncbi:MAG: bifunctional hydroxymethylpyrimidine kinase/phosphomethylpyrimidine kinase [Chitinophagaceae bacterium]
MQPGTGTLTVDATRNTHGSGCTLSSAIPGQGRTATPLYM